MTIDLSAKVEGVLFFKNEPVSFKKLAEVLKVSKEEIIDAVLKLKNDLSARGIVLLEKEEEITLGTHADLSDLIENLVKEELNKELSKASLETLSIIIYKNGVSRSEIDFIRGVSSVFTLRILSIRGLIERIVDPKDSRAYIYKPSFKLLSFLGIKSVDELPEYFDINNLLEATAKEATVKNEN
jgi:segregation and condensation protein B